MTCIDVDGSQSRDEAGFSVVETMVVIAVASILLALTAIGIPRFLEANGFDQGTRQVREDLVFAHERVTAEASPNRIYGVHFEDNSPHYQIFEGDTSNVVESVELGDDVYVVSASCTRPGESPGDICYFYARGSASPGTIELGQYGTDRSATLQIAELTGTVTDG